MYNLTIHTKRHFIRFRPCAVLFHMNYKNIQDIPTKTIEECNENLKNKDYTDKQIQEINDTMDRIIDIVFDEYINNLLS